MAQKSKSKSMIEKAEKITLHYYFIQSVTQIVIAVAVFVGFIVSVFPLIEENHDVLGIKLEFYVITVFVIILSTLIYWTYKRLLK